MLLAQDTQSFITIPLSSAFFVPINSGALSLCSGLPQQEPRILDRIENFIEVVRF